MILRFARLARIWTVRPESVYRVNYEDRIYTFGLLPASVSLAGEHWNCFMFTLVEAQFNNLSTILINRKTSIRVPISLMMPDTFFNEIISVN